VWQAHILQTTFYYDFCLNVFGHYFHHDLPILRTPKEKMKLKKSFEKTQEIYKHEFGGYINKIKSGLLISTVIRIYESYKKQLVNYEEGYYKIF